MSKKTMERQEFFIHLDALLDESRKNDKPLALVVIKTRQMRDINLSYGYAFGDAVIAKIEGIINSISRDDDQLIRIDNNEFIMILPGIRNQGQAVLAANRMINELKNPVVIENHSITININIGVAVMPQHGKKAMELLQAADKALGDSMSIYSQYSIYSGNEIKKEPTLMMLEQDFRKSIYNDELVIYYQPKIELKSNKVIGLEALTRWFSPEHGSVSPEIFIAIAEKSGLIREQTKWLLNNALRQCAESGLNDDSDFSLALNLSPDLLKNNDITNVIYSALQVWDTNAKHLTLEITEEAVMENPDLCLGILSEIHSTGVRLSIDDFGTGYSSLAYLKKLPVDELKIDRSFVMNMEDSKEDVTIIRSIIELAHNFGLTVVAEGVESRIALDMLTELGCDYIQGFYIAQPMSMPETLQWMDDYKNIKLTG